MNLYLRVLFMVFVFLSCSKEDKFTGSGNIVSESRDVSSFTKVDNSTSINVVIIESDTQEVEVSADDNIINSVQTIVENGVLKIGLTNGNYNDVTITLSISIGNLEGLENTGSGNMTVSGFQNLSNLTIDNEGSGNITNNGSGITLSLSNSGSGDYKGFGFSSQNCIVVNSGSGNCEINCTTELNGSNSGSGSVFYKGSPTVDITNTGSGKIVDSN